MSIVGRQPAVESQHRQRASQDRAHEVTTSFDGSNGPGQGVPVGLPAFLRSVPPGVRNRLDYRTRLSASAITFAFVPKSMSSVQPISRGREWVFGSGRGRELNKGSLSGGQPSEQ